jgi:hypothetical protein
LFLSIPTHPTTKVARPVALDHHESVRKSWWLLSAVFLISFLCLSFRIAGSGLASAHVDPVARIAAQDEAVYSAIATDMACNGTWLTPRFLGRYALFKPPLLYWISGLSAKLLGVSNFSLRLPSLLAGALLITIAIAWLRTAGLLPALIAGLLLLSNPLLQTLSRLNLTDATLALLLALAAWRLKSDPRLSTSRSRWIFAAISAAAIMTKAVAGGLSLLLLLSFFLLARADFRPAFRSILQVFGYTALLAAPWHLYQFAVHPHWFWAEYVVDEHFRSALNPLGQTSDENQVWFYVRRWWLMDPVLLIAFLIGLPGFLIALRKRASAETVVLACWVGVVAAAVLLFSYRNVAYFLPALVPAAIIAASCRLFYRRTAAALVLALLCIGFAWRTQQPEKTWGLPFPVEASAPSARPLQQYAALHRPNRLIIVFPEDQFYSAMLGLPRVSYAFIDDGRTRQQPAMDFRYLGITVTVPEFLALAHWMPEFRARLREFDFNSDEPVATVIELRGEQDLSGLIANSPESDFYLPERLLKQIQTTHSATPLEEGRGFLLSNR